MATRSDNFFGSASAASSRDPRDAVFARELDAVAEPVIEAALAAFEVLKLLPRAFVDSQQRELKRVEESESEDKESARVQRLRESIAQAQVLGETSELGLARVERGLALREDTAQLVHGFVSDAQLRPLAKLRVVLEDGKDKPRTASTDADGYFRIVIGDRGPTLDVARLAAQLARGTAAKTDAKNAGVKAAAAAATAATGTDPNAGPTARLTIFDANGTLLHTDADDIALDAGNVYREYVISADPADGNTPPKDRQTTPPGDKGTAAPVDTKTAADADAKAKAEAAAKADAAAGSAAPAPAATTTGATPKDPAQPATKASAATAKKAATKPLAKATTKPIAKKAPTTRRKPK